jgi:drug/metabolite transporter (DMT)-like permease
MSSPAPPTGPSAPSAPTMGAREWALLVVLSVLWGASFYFFKVLLAELPTLTVVLGRLGLAALLMNLFIVLKGDSMPSSPRLWGAFIVMGLLNNVVPFILLVWSEIRISSGLAAILNATTPIFAVLVAHFTTTNEKLNWSKGIGVLCAFLGVVLLIGPSILASAIGDQLLADLACLLAAFIFALAGIYGRRFKGLPALTVATGQVTASTLVVLPVTLIVDRPWNLPSPSFQAWQALAGIAVLSTALAYVMYFRILATAGATNTLLVTFLVPISAILLGVVFLSEAFTTETLGGMLLIGAGLAAIDGRLPAALRRAILPGARAPRAPD